MRSALTKPLFLKQALYTLLFAVGLSLVASLIKFYTDIIEVRSNVDKEFTQLLELIEKPAEQAAFRFDTVFANQLVNGLTKKTLVYRAELASEDGSLLGVAKRDDFKSRFYKIMADFLLPGVAHYSIPLTYEGSALFVGKLSIWVDQELVVQNFINESLDGLFISLLKDIFLASLISLVFFVIVTRPLKKLTTILLGHSEDLSQPLPKLDDTEFVNNELGALSDAFSEIWWKLESTLKALERSDAHSKAIISQAGDAIFLSDMEGQISLVNKAAVKMVGIDEYQLTHSHLRSLHAEDTWVDFYQDLIKQPLDTPLTIETQYRHSSGVVTPIEIRLIKYVLQESIEVLILARDISARKEAEDKINHLAYYDSLTHLPNRHWIMEKLELSMSISRERKVKGAVLFLDLDRFKNINDSLGHDVGDQLLQVVANDFKVLTDGDTCVARLGGDEFVFLFPYLEGDIELITEKVAIFAQQIVQSFNKAKFVGSHEMHISVSIGITLFDGFEDNVGVLLKQADTALYKAKDAGRNTYRFYKAEMQVMTDDRLKLEKALHRAMTHNEFELYYQPQNNVKGELLGAEALIRWHDGENGFIPPTQFIPLAEEIGLIIELGEWVMENAFYQLSQWLKRGLWKPEWTLSINVSPIQFQHPEFMINLERLLLKYNIPATLIDIEITENMLLTDLQASRLKMEHIRSLGMKLSIDDFGTGYSSLQYLKTLPIERLKIDQSFVRDLLVDSGDAAIVGAVIAMSGALDIEVLAEGVETQEHLQRLEDMGCLNYQGYLFGRPVSATQFTFNHLLATSFQNDSIT